MPLPRGGAMALFAVAVLLVSGCTSAADVSEFAKSLPEVERFLADHPNAQIKAVLWPEAAVQESIDAIRQDCGGPVPARNYFRVAVTEGPTELVVWLDLATSQPACVIKLARAPTPVTDAPKPPEAVAPEGGEVARLPPDETGGSGATPLAATDSVAEVSLPSSSCPLGGKCFRLMLGEQKRVLTVNGRDLAARFEDVALDGSVLLNVNGEARRTTPRAVAIFPESGLAALVEAVEVANDGTESLVLSLMDSIPLDQQTIGVLDVDGVRYKARLVGVSSPTEVAVTIDGTEVLLSRGLPMVVSGGALLLRVEKTETNGDPEAPVWLSFGRPG